MSDTTASFNIDALVTQLAGEEAIKNFAYDDATGDLIRAGSIVSGNPTVGIGRNLASDGITDDERRRGWQRAQHPPRGLSTWEDASEAATNAVCDSWSVAAGNIRIAMRLFARWIRCMHAGRPLSLSMARLRVLIAWGANGQKTAASRMSPTRPTGPRMVEQRARSETSR
jgi:hypothetical protein